MTGFWPGIGYHAPLAGVRRHTEPVMPISRMKSRITLLFLAIATAALAACHTVQGLGQDITYIGEKGEEAISQ